jgi:pyrrolidone-carboxylate peptidase
MRQLSAWIDELRPATVLCFGQGASDGFAIETRAHNERGSVPDNLNLTPPTAVIVSDGPMEYEATVNSRALVEALTKQGYPVRASQDAGRYLCEEALFTIEHLKAQHRIPGDVMFCHVPPLGAKIGDESVDAAYVQTFVEALLAAWLELPHENTTVAAPAEVTLRQVADDPREAQVRELIERYFLTWNAQDIDRYGQCFMPQAAVQLMAPSGRLTTLPLRAFLESQREAHKNSAGMNETPESVEVRLEGRLARVIVHWKLVAGDKVQFGYDHFTIMPVNGQWRIANLIFYETQGEDGR